jgi:hypothetical protein
VPVVNDLVPRDNSWSEKQVERSTQWLHSRVAILWLAKSVRKLCDGCLYGVVLGVDGDLVSHLSRSHSGAVRMRARADQGPGLGQTMMVRLVSLCWGSSGVVEITSMKLQSLRTG